MKTTLEKTVQLAIRHLAKWMMGSTVASKPAPLRMVYNTAGREVQLASGKVPALAPFEKTVVEFTCGNLFKPGVSYKTSVIIHPDGQRPVTLQRTLNPENETE